jgi:NAD(P)-dependent dehydrogenase (short-subunit alcohol dehydrogenase family)
MPVEIRGRWALVTGASRGIGRQLARGLAQRGCNVVLHSRERAHTAALEEELRRGGVRAASVAAELEDPGQVDRMVDEALAASGGGLDIAYNNAAIQFRPRADWMATPAEEYRRSFQANTIAPIRISCRLLPQMLSRGWGRIVQLTSGIRDNPELMTYAVSKAALDKFVRDAAPKLRGTGVVMSLLDPGWLRTDMGGPNATSDVESVLPGALVPVLVDGEVHGAFFNAQDWAGKVVR